MSEIQQTCPACGHSIHSDAHKKTAAQCSRIKQRLYQTEPQHSVLTQRPFAARKMENGQFLTPEYY